jgi:N-acetylneuraminic acid mutarotase
VLIAMTMGKLACAAMAAMVVGAQGDPVRTVVDRIAFRSSQAVAAGERRHSAPGWRVGASIPTARNNPGACAANDIVYVAGGWTLDAVGYVHVTAAFEGYDPVSNTWNTTLPAMPTARARVGLAAVGGIIYAVGGSSISQSANALATVESYDPVSGSWSKNHTPMPTARYVATQ